MLITCVDTNGRSTGVHELYEALRQPAPLRGRVSFAEPGEVPEGALGGITDALLTHGLDALVGVVVGAVVGWLQRRSGPPVEVRIAIPPNPPVALGSAEVTGLTEEQLRALVEKVRRELETRPADGDDQQ
ncbi:effector-associated constant component EACC1 [Micromonospora sp. NBS 11-29]|uniref:effector-associated constant component EACC1 n=1 Tax=Micromonospora sp. NBS 11-29 TaxID=1960879 RepID=UPI000B77AA04|nr:hypothetical protein [Micromonospora sp. NBS 11-29]